MLSLHHKWMSEILRPGVRRMYELHATLHPEPFGSRRRSTLRAQGSFPQAETSSRTCMAVRADPSMAVGHRSYHTPQVSESR